MNPSTRDLGVNTSIPTSDFTQNTFYPTLASTGTSPISPDPLYTRSSQTPASFNETLTNAPPRPTVSFETQTENLAQGVHVNTQTYPQPQTMTPLVEGMI
jgi:hypothetical protein